MKITELDWEEALGQLRRWDGLSPAARRAYLDLRPGTGMTRARLGEAAADELLGAGMVEPPSERSSLLAVTPDTRRFHVLVRAMDRVRVLDGPERMLDAYVKEHFTAEQTSRLAGQQAADAGWYRSRTDNAALVETVDWVRGVLALRTPDQALRWEIPRRVPGEPTTLAVPHTLSALQRLLRALAEHPHGIPFATLDAVLPDVDPPVRAAAVRAGIRYLLLFPALRGAGMDACLGLLPAVARRMGPPPAAPAPVTPAQTFEAAFRMADMTALLVEAAAEPIPVRGADGSLYVRSQKAIAPRLLGLPPWVADFATFGEDDDSALPPGVEERITFAVELLTSRKLASIAQAGDRYQLRPTASGRRWLALDERERLKEVLKPWRESAQRMPMGWYSDGRETDFFGVRAGFDLTRFAGLDGRAALEQAFLSIPPGVMVSLREFVRHQSEVNNPFLVEGVPQRGRQYGWGHMPSRREEWEALWAKVLFGFVMLRLVPFGGGRLGVVGDPAQERHAFALTDAGRYLLGGADDFELAAAPEGEVVVQPDFEIVFLAAAPRVEAELGRFAERTGAGVGALFRITRASVLRAAEQGLTADAVVGTLERVSRSGVPANVARQVRDWIGATRRVSVHPAVLVECPDAETAGRVRALGGPQVAEVTPTVLRLDATGKARAAFIKKLRDKGIFVHD